MGITRSLSPRGIRLRPPFAPHSPYLNGIVCHLGSLYIPTAPGASLITTNANPCCCIWMTLWFSCLQCLKTLEWLELVLGRLHCQLSKCVFFLDHVISVQGVATDPNKIEAVAQWRCPTSVSELWFVVLFFLLSISYYSCWETKVRWSIPPPPLTSSPMARFESV